VTRFSRVHHCKSLFVVERVNAVCDDHQSVSAQPAPMSAVHELSQLYVILLSSMDAIFSFLPYRGSARELCAIW
jgi:hypothetical protein